jgi:hypothetical protein
MQTRLAEIVAGFEQQPADPTYFKILCADTIDGGLPDLGTDSGQAEIDAATGDAELIIVEERGRKLAPGSGVGARTSPRRAKCLVHSPCGEGWPSAWHISS